MNFSTTRASWNKVAAAYDEQAEPLDPPNLAALDAFAAQVHGPVADIGCGPGDTTAHLHARGVTVFGIDLSPGMLAVARAKYPDLRFDEGSMTALDLPDGHLGGILSWYSIVNIPPQTLSAVFAEFHRVLAPGGQLLLAFRFGEDDVKHYDEGFGHSVSLDFYRHTPQRITDELTRAGFTPNSPHLRELTDALHTPQAIITAAKLI